MLKIFIITSILMCLFLEGKGGPVPIKLEASKGNKGKLEFALQLPNNDTVQIDLSFQLLIASEPLNETVKVETSTSLAETAKTTTTTIPEIEKKYVTVAEAIEGFRQELVKKEKDIAGIIESPHPFYRHFKLEFDDNIDISIRCTYDSNYAKRSLNISCYEYREYETERILSNGEVELIRLEDPNYKTNVELVDLKSAKQVYTMEIS